MNKTPHPFLTWLITASLALASAGASAGDGYASGQYYNNNNNQSRSGYGQHSYPTTQSNQSFSSNSRGNDNNNARTPTRRTRTAYQIAHDYPASNSPNPKKQAREEQLRSLAESPNVPNRQHKWIMNRYTHIDNRRMDIQKAEERIQKKSAKPPSKAGSYSGSNFHMWPYAVQIVIG